MAAIRLEFAQFGHFYSFDVIRSTTSMAGIADVDLPTPIATGLKTMYYVDTNVIKSRMYFYKVRVHRGGISFVSAELKTYAIPAESYIFKTPFSVNFTDDVGKFWNSVGYTSIALNALKLTNTGTTVQMYLSTNIANFSRVFSNADFSMRMKIKFDRTTGVHILCSCRNYNQGAGFFLGIIDGVLMFCIYNNSTTPNIVFEQPVVLNTNDFFEVSIERKDQKYYLYFKYLLLSSSGVTTGIKTPTHTPFGGVTLGALSDDDRYFLSGYLKDFELFDFALGDGGSQSPIF